jgi:hypothetical protein
MYNAHRAIAVLNTSHQDFAWSGVVPQSNCVFIITAVITVAAYREKGSLSEVAHQQYTPALIGVGISSHSFHCLQVKTFSFFSFVVNIEASCKVVELWRVKKTGKIIS